jgi:putative sigma-54 modulation protein
MDSAISARHGTLTPDAHDYIEKKLPKLVHLHDKVQSVQVTVDFSAHGPEVELVVTEPHRQFVAKEAQPTVQAAFDNALAKMEGQLRKHKEKVQEHHSGVDKHAR